jgi:hypothetical protein
MSARDIAITADVVDIALPRLVISFWDLRLDNLPIGRFERCPVPIDGARELIDAARAGGRLLCVTSKDLLAPYGVKHLRRYREMCTLLKTEFGIALGVEEFTSVQSEPHVRCINPLECVQLAARDQMLIATCNYTTNANSGDVDIDQRFSLAPDSLRFDLIAAIELDPRPG